MAERFTRTLQLDLSRADDGATTAPAVISTEFPVERAGYREILSHSPGAVDLSRAPLPLIESHDNSRVNVGIVENLHLSAGKLRGQVRLGNTTRARELWADIKSGIVRSLSVGYSWLDYQESGNDILVTRWQPHEVSLVAAPADPNSGLFRAMNTELDETKTLSRSQRRALRAEEATGSSDGAMEAITALAEYLEPRIRADANPKWLRALDDAVARAHEHRDFDTFKAEVWKNETTRQAARPAAAVPTHEQRPYSIASAIRSLVDPRYRGGGYESEISQELAHQRGKATQGILVPLSHPGEPHQRTWVTTGAAPTLVPTTTMAAEFIDVLRARSVVLSLGVHALSGLRGDVVIPRKTAGASASWIGAEGDSLTESSPTFGGINLYPRTVGGLVTFSHKMLIQSSPDIEQVVRQDLADTLATAVDQAAINGTGAVGQPLGLLNSGIHQTSYSSAPTFADLVDMEGRIAANSADAATMAYLTTPALMATMKQTALDSGSGKFIWSAGARPGQGTVNGLPALYSANVPTGYVLLGDWSQLIYATWGVLEILADPYGDNFAKGSISVRALMDCNFGLRHAEAFEGIHA